uniref:Uncharacterized protein n=1 Tax=Ditylenchus dipsaci TaxID=166011 RepID=A0A915DY61_9BILA
MFVCSITATSSRVTVANYHQHIDLHQPARIERNQAVLDWTSLWDLSSSLDSKLYIVFVVNLTEEDPILVVRLNQNWIAAHTEAHANVVLDSIVTHNMVNARRDDQAPRLCFHFFEGSHIADCRLAVRKVHYEAFAPSPDMLDLLNAENTPWKKS